MMKPSREIHPGIRRPRPGAALRARLVRELPWLAACAFAVWSLRAVIPTLDHPWGSNWPMYFEAAHFFWDSSAAYFGWRPPLYPLLLATTGQVWGYVASAHAIAQVSMVVLVFAAGWMARLLGGVGPAILAVLTIPWLQCAVEGSLWTNMYPPAAALLGLTVAMGTLCFRRPGVATAAGTGWLAGMAWKINHLGLVGIPISLGLVLLGARRWKAAALLLAVYSGGLGTATAIDHWVVRHYDVPQDDLSVQVLQRRREELERIEQSRTDAQKYSACTDFEPKPLNLAELTNGCAVQFVAANYGTLRAEDCVPEPRTLMWLLPLVLLPAAGTRWRTSVASGLIFGGALGAFSLAAAWTSYAEKYALSFLPMMVLIAPLSFDRLGSTLGRAWDRIALGRTLGWLAAAAWIGWVWPMPSTWHADSPNVQQDWEYVSGRVANWARARLGPDDLLLDCVPLSIDLVLLPDERPIREGVGTETECRGWIRTPPAAKGTVWLLQRSFDQQSFTQPDAIRAQGWELADEYPQGHRLWRHRR